MTLARRTALGLAGCAALLLSAPPPFIPPAHASGQHHLAADSEDRWVAFELTPAHQIRFRTLLNGRWVNALLDTGISDSAMTRSYAQRVGMKPLVTGRADTIGGSVAIAWTGIERVEVGGLVRTGGRLAIIDVDPRVTASAPVDLFIGADLLARHALDIDYAARRFRLLPSGRLPFRGTTSTLRMADQSRLYLSDLDIGGKQMRRVMIDTGDGGMLSLTPAIWAARPPFSGPMTSAIAWGLGGTVVNDIAVLPNLRIGGMGGQEVEVRIEPVDGFTARKGASGRIGGGWLRRHRLLLDPSAGRMVLAVSGALPDPLPRSTSGLLLEHQGNRLRVLHVMRGSPAAAAGWRNDAMICHIDGAPVGSAGADWTIGQPGRRLTLTLCSGEVRTLTLSRFY